MIWIQAVLKWKVNFLTLLVLQSKRNRHQWSFFCGVPSLIVADDGTGVVRLPKTAIQQVERWRVFCKSLMDKNSKLVFQYVGVGRPGKVMWHSSKTSRSKNGQGAVVVCISEPGRGQTCFFWTKNVVVVGVCKCNVLLLGVRSIITLWKLSFLFSRGGTGMDKSIVFVFMRMYLSFTIGNEDVDVVWSSVWVAVICALSIVFCGE